MSKRPTSSYVIAISSLLLAGLALSQPIFFGFGDLIETLLWIGFALALVWLGYVIPSAEVVDGELLITNPFRVARIGIGAIEDVDTRFALKVTGSFGSVSAWAAPAPGRLRYRSHSTQDYRTLGLKDGELVRPGDLPSTISGSLAMQIRLAQRQGGQLPTKVQINLNPLGIALAVVPGLLLVAHYWT
jgi:hypothetical protein